MLMNDIDELNKKFSVDDTISFTTGKGDLPFINISTDKAKASVCLNGGQVVSYRPINSDQDLMFVSKHAYYQPGKSIKGGAPICWPWFAANKDDKTLPFHGFVRNQLWQVLSTEVLDNNDVVLTLLFNDTKQSREIWPYNFELLEKITIGDRLKIELITKNTGTNVFSISQAIHTYFSIGDISQVKVTGLENNLYLDKVENFAEKTQLNEIRIDAEVDRIYQQVEKSLYIKDAAFNREIQIEHDGSSTAVVWNPWVNISKESQDLEDDDYKRFICVETANAADEVIIVPAGEEYILTATYSIQEK